MPKVPIDYTNTIIYKIVCNDLNITDLYVGHTTQFTKRRCLHKHSCNNENSKGYNLKVYSTIRENGGWENWSMIEVEKYNCNDKNEATARERYWYETLESKLNSICPKQSQKEYYENNKDKILKTQKDYYEINKDKSKEYYEINKDKILKQFKENYEKKKDKISERRKDYYENNKEKIAKRKKEYYENKRVEIAKGRKEYYENKKYEISKSQKEYYENNKEKIAKSKKEYYENSKEKIPINKSL